ncbi:MAG: serine/threonine-protein kinase [Candidatus Acidiferrales bacterium]
MERLGRYEILEELGRGAMGLVYRGRDPQIDRIVAIKTINVELLDPGIVDEFRQRFFREAQAAGRLTHPGIVTVYDVGEDPESKTPFIVMEYVKGTTLELLLSGERMARAPALDLGRQIAEALDYAHSQQIVHRDINPANVLITADGHSKITDFGVAKVLTGRYTQTGQVLGTPQYMAPEQLMGQSVDGRADLFALGMIFYWLLTGEQPFRGESMATLTFKIVYAQPLPPTKLDPTLNPDYDYVLNRALAKEPARRYQVGREFADDLDDILHDRPPRSRSVVRVPTAEPVASSDTPQPAGAAPSRPPDTDQLQRSPLAPGTGPALHAWPAWLRQQRFLLGAATLATFLALLAVIGWWPREAGISSDTGGQQPAQQAAQPAGGASEPHPSGTSTSTSAGAPEAAVAVQPLATLRITGENPYKEATLWAYADGKLIRRVRLQSKGGKDKFTTLVAVAPGRHTFAVRLKQEGGSLEQNKDIAGNLASGQTRTLEVGFDRTAKSFWSRKMSLRWLD